MSANAETLEILKRNFREKLASETIEVKLIDIYLDWHDPDETWLFKPMSATTKQNVIRLYMEHKIVEAQIEGIISRAINEDGSRKFAPANARQFMSFDPEFIDAIATRIHAQIDDVVLSPIDEKRADPLGNSN